MRAVLLASCLMLVAAPAVADPDWSGDPRTSGTRVAREQRDMQRGDMQRRERADTDVTASSSADVRASQRRMERMEQSVARPASDEQPVLRDVDRGEALGRMEPRSRPEQMDERWRGSREVEWDRRPGRDPAADSVANWHREDRARDRNPAIPTGTADRWARSGGQVTAGWRQDWRRDRRFDWQDQRRRNGAQFHLALYIDPFGWGYRPVGLGWALDREYYDARYGLADPWSYRLPLAPPGYRWVRYYDDALLVDLRSGRVVDVLSGIFW
jgi:Nickel/cobalt transporter regulator